MKYLVTTRSQWNYESADANSLVPQMKPRTAGCARKRLNLPFHNDQSTNNIDQQPKAVNRFVAKQRKQRIAYPSIFAELAELDQYWGMPRF